MSTSLLDDVLKHTMIPVHSFYNVAIYSFAVSHCLVHWSGEACVTVVSRQMVLGEQLMVGKEYSVKWGQERYIASVAAVGECVHVVVWGCMHVCMLPLQFVVNTGYITVCGVCVHIHVCLCLCMCECRSMFMHVCCHCYSQSIQVYWIYNYDMSQLCTCIDT